MTLRDLKVRRVITKALLYAVMIVVAIYTVGPFVWAISTAFKGPGENVYAFPPRILPEEPTLSNFVTAWQRVPYFGQYFINSLLIAGGSILINIGASSMAGYALARLQFPGRSLAFWIILSTMMIPFQVVMIPLFLVVLRLGLLNTHLGVILPTAVTAFSIFLFRQAFLKLPKELEDAARIDGCSEWGIYWRIMLPLTKPTIATMVIFTFVSSWGEFLWPLIVLRSPRMYTVAVGLAYLQSQFSANLRWIMAGSVLATVPVLIVFLAFQRYFIEGATAGALKG